MGTMKEPRRGSQDGLSESGILDRSEQAARFLDLTRRHSSFEGDHADLFASLAAADLDGDGVQDIIGANVEIRTELVDESIRDNDADDVKIDSAAFGVMPAGTTSSSVLDDDGDAFGDGNGFGSEPGSPLTLRSTDRQRLCELERADVLGLIALTARNHIELDGLTLLEVLEAIACDAGVVHEHICAAFARDEAVPLLGVEKLDCTCGHWTLLSTTSGRRCDCMSDPTFPERVDVTLRPACLSVTGVSAVRQVSAARW